MGNLEFWDLLMSHKRPILTIKYKYAVTHLVFKPDGTMLTVSLANGDCLMLRLEEGMRSATNKEKSLMMSVSDDYHLFQIPMFSNVFPESSDV